MPYNGRYTYCIRDIVTDIFSHNENYFVFFRFLVKNFVTLHSKIGDVHQPLG